MKRKLKALLFRFLVLFLVLYACYILLRQKEDTSVELQLKQQLDLAIEEHAQQVLGKHLINYNITTSRETRQKIKTTQTRFVCYICQGSWLAEAPKRARYRHDEKCIEGWPSLERLDLQELTELFCNRLAGKRILIAGPLPFYHAQTLLLEALAKHDGTSYPRRNPESSSHYFVCGGSQYEEQPLPNSTYNPRNALKWKSSSHNMTRISFSLSDSLLPFYDAKDGEITEPIVDSRTQVRVQVSNWLNESEKAQILILNKGPIPAPAWTFDGGGTGNWSFVQKENGSQEETLTAKVVNAAFDVVSEVYLPELLRTLDAVEEGIKQYTIFIGSWYQQPTCTNFGLNASFRTTRLFWEPYHRIDPWSLYYNTQGMIVSIRIDRLALLTSPVSLHYR